MNELSIWHWTIIAIVVGAIWLPLPFAVYGIKRRQDRQIELLSSLVERSAPPAEGPHAAP